MAEPPVPASKHKFYVAVIDDKRNVIGVHSGWDVANGAENTCKQANAEAEKLGIAARYEVVAN